MGRHLRILIVDDQSIFRRGLRDVLEQAEDMAVVGEAADGQQAVELASELRPGGLDLVLMDIDMPVLDGIAATQRIVSVDPGLPVVMLSDSNEEPDVEAAVRAGAIGFLSKAVPPEALVRALRDFDREGALPMSRAIAARLLAHLRSVAAYELASTQAQSAAAEPTAMAALTRREREVLDLIALGARDRDIADKLNLTLNTVKKHVKNILEKLGARNRAQAAARHGEMTRPLTRPEASKPRR
jgi:DNA-binding NarL/FixJ family response regulator